MALLAGLPETTFRQVGAIELEAMFRLVPVLVLLSGTLRKRSNALLYSELAHSVSEGARVEAKNPGSTIWTFNSPGGLLEYVRDVIFLNLFKGS